MKKTMAMLLALVMLFALCAPAMAETAGTITVSNATAGYEYSVYRLLDLASYQDEKPNDPADGIYAYKINEKWAAFFALDTTKAYIDTDANGVITWKTGADAAAFAQAALKYADDHDIKADGSATAVQDGALEISVDTLGYYLLDSTLGALCSLDTTNPNVTVTDKNYLPTLTKKVNGADTCTASIGETVEFTVTIEAGVGHSKYVLKDHLEDGFTLDASSIEVSFTAADGEGESENLTANTDYTLTTTDLTDGADFQIVFEKAFLDTCKNNDKIIVTYSALVNAGAASENKNTVYLTTDNEAVSREDSTTTNTYKFDLVKTDSNGVLLTGAEFELYDSATEGNKINLAKDGESYRPALAGETAAVIDVTGGKVTIFGLASDTYYLQETVAPTGYNMLTGRVTVKLTSDLTATVNQGEGNVLTYDNGGVRVINYTGSELPSTGGIGTTVFYAMGGLLMAAAVVLLVARKKTESNK